MTMEVLFGCESFAPTIWVYITANENPLLTGNYGKFDEEISFDEKAVLIFRVRNTNDEMIETTKEYLRSPDDPDIGWIPTTFPEKNRLHQISLRKRLMILPIESLSHHCRKNSYLSTSAFGAFHSQLHFV